MGARTIAALTAAQLSRPPMWHLTGGRSGCRGQGHGKRRLTLLIAADAGRHFRAAALRNQRLDAW